ncbi:MAG: DUF5652 family protein [Patescibacteria group bacterium]
MDQIILQNYSWIVVLIVLWCLPWKVIALWKSARLNSKAWFIVLLLVNTLGILEILYIFVFSRKAQKSKLKV